MSHRILNFSARLKRSQLLSAVGIPDIVEAVAQYVQPAVQHALKSEVKKLQKNRILSHGSEAQLFAVTLKPKEIIDLCSIIIRFHNKLAWDFASCKEVRVLIENGVVQ